MALIGYGRVSTSAQSTDLQTDALKAAGCERIFTDEMSGGSTKRPGLDEALSYMRPGDVLVVWRLDRLGRSLRHLIDVINDLKTRGIEFRSLTEQIDTSTSAGKLTFHVMGALAEFEKSIIVERVNAGLEAARRRGGSTGINKVLNVAVECSTAGLCRDHC